MSLGRGDDIFYDFSFRRVVNNARFGSLLRNNNARYRLSRAQPTRRVRSARTEKCRGGGLGRAENFSRICHAKRQCNDDDVHFYSSVNRDQVSVGAVGAPAPTEHPQFFKRSPFVPLNAPTIFFNLL